MRVTLNKQLEIKNIKVDNNKLILPLNVEIASEEMNGQLFSAFQSGKPDQNIPPGAISYKINDIKRVSDSSASTQTEVTVEFNDLLRVRCIALGNERGTWLFWPDNFDILNKMFQRYLEKNILKALQE